jgi:hypothetical protein
MTNMDNESKFPKSSNIYIYIEREREIEQVEQNIGIVFFYAKVHIWEI